jgi:integrase/ribosome assembly protein YihI (activator of Der GTPase)
MELSIKEFLDSVSNPNTKKEYRHGIKKFCEWYGKSAEEILELRKDDLTQKAEENLIEYRNRAARFEKEIEKFHSYLLDQKFAINSARNLTIGIRQLFRFYQMPIRIRAGSKVAKTVKTTKNFPLTIEHVRAMFKVADLRERIVLSMATDLGLRIGDFIALKKTDLPPLDQEPPISFDVMTDKEDVVAHGFLSQESVDLLKAYLPTLGRKNGNGYLFPSNGESHISDEWMNRLLQRLADKAQIGMNGKDLTFHCFRKMYLSAAIDSGIGLTAGKKLCGKAIAESDDTYLTTVHLRDKFLQLKRFLAIREQPKIEAEKIESLKSAINRLQEELTQQRVITDTISEENVKVKKEIKKLNPLIDFVNRLEENGQLQIFLDLLENSEEIAFPEGSFVRFDLPKEVSESVDRRAKEKGISKQEVYDLMMKAWIEAGEKAEKSEAPRQDGK